MAFTHSLTFPGTVEWGTPGDLFDPLHNRWSFTLDGAASHGNALVSRYCTAMGTFERLRGREACSHPPNREHEWIDDPLRETSGLRLCRWCSVVEPGTFEHEVQRIDPRDGLQFPWSNERVFLNPPWGDAEAACEPECIKTRCEARGGHLDLPLPGIKQFVIKAVREVLWNRATVVMIVPSRTDNQWFQGWLAHEPYARIEFLPGRPRFIDPTPQARTQPPVGVALVTLR